MVKKRSVVFALMLAVLLALALSSAVSAGPMYVGKAAPVITEISFTTNTVTVTWSKDAGKPTYIYAWWDNDYDRSSYTGASRKPTHAELVAGQMTFSTGNWVPVAVTGVAENRLGSDTWSSPGF